MVTPTGAKMSSLTTKELLNCWRGSTAVPHTRRFHRVVPRPSSPDAGVLAVSPCHTSCTSSTVRFRCSCRNCIKPLVPGSAAPSSVSAANIWWTNMAFTGRCRPLPEWREDEYARNALDVPLSQVQREESASTAVRVRWLRAAHSQAARRTTAKATR